MTAQLLQFKHEKITALIDALLQNPCRKNLEKIIGILLWATSLVHHVRFLLTSLYCENHARKMRTFFTRRLEPKTFSNKLQLNKVQSSLRQTSAKTTQVRSKAKTS